jgi:hypothetical protein
MEKENDNPSLKMAEHLNSSAARRSVPKSEFTFLESATKRNSVKPEANENVAVSGFPSEMSTKELTLFLKGKFVNLKEEKQQKREYSLQDGLK